MKNTHLKLLTPVIFITFLFFSCTDNEKKNVASATKKQTLPLQIGAIKTDTLPLDLQKSTLNWKGKKMFENEGHNGLVEISNGTVIFDSSKKIVGGEIKIDMNTITCIDISSPRLINHLKGKDFFNVMKYPYSTFTVERATDSTLLGNLTICGKTMPYVAKYTYSNEEIVGNLIFDRQKFGISYHSPSTFFLEKIGKKLKEKVISDEIEISFSLAPLK